MKPTGDKKLAMAVIGKTIDDLIAIKFDTENHDFKECFDFLTGKTETAKFWFECADLKPLADADVIPTIKAQYGLDDQEPEPGWDDTFQVYTI